MLDSLLEFLGMRHSPEDIRWAEVCARDKAIGVIASAIGGSAIDKHKQLRIDNIPPNDPQWMLAVSPDIWESAQSIGVDKFAGLRLVPMNDKK